MLRWYQRTLQHKNLLGLKKKVRSIYQITFKGKEKKETQNQAERKLLNTNMWLNQYQALHDCTENQEYKKEL